MQSGLDRQHVGARILHPQAIKRHDKARRAETALAAVMFDHRRLNRMQPAVAAAQMLDGDDVAAMARGEKADAGVDRLVMQMAVMQPAHQNRAGAAIALGAALLGAGQAQVQSQKVQKRVARAGLGQADLGIVQKKAQFAAHQVLASVAGYGESLDSKCPLRNHGMSIRLSAIL